MKEGCQSWTVLFYILLLCVFHSFWNLHVYAICIRTVSWPHPAPISSGTNPESAQCLWSDISDWGLALNITLGQRLKYAHGGPFFWISVTYLDFTHGHLTLAFSENFACALQRWSWRSIWWYRRYSVVFPLASPRFSMSDLASLLFINLMGWLVLADTLPDNATLPTMFSMWHDRVSRNIFNPTSVSITMRPLYGSGHSPECRSAYS